MPYPNLNYVAQIESRNGQDPTSRTPNSAGVLGTYQLTPIAWKDLQQIYPEKYGKIDFRTGALSNQISQQAVQDLFVVGAKRLQAFGLPVTEENLLAVYNAGIGTVKNARGDVSRYPTETRDYIRKYKALNKNGNRIQVLR